MKSTPRKSIRKIYGKPFQRNELIKQIKYCLFRRDELESIELFPKFTLH